MAVEPSLWDALSSHNASIFCDYLSSKPTLGRLEATTNVTIFAPTDTAFQSASNTAFLDQHPVADIQYHFVHGVHTSEAIRNRTWDGEHPVMYTMLDTFLEGEKWENVTGGQKIAASGGASSGLSLRAGYGSIATTPVGCSFFNDIWFDGGIIHLVDQVLYFPSRAGEQLSELVDPTSSSELPQTNVLLEGLKITGLLEEIEVLPNVTILVPYDKSFYKIGSIFDGMPMDELRNMLKYHIFVGNVTYAETISPMDPSWSSYPLTLANLTVNMTHAQGGSNQLEFDGSESIQDILIANGNLITIGDVLDPNHRTGEKFPGATSVSMDKPLFANIIPERTPSNTSATPSVSPLGTSSSSTQERSLSLDAEIGIGVGSALGGTVLLLAISWMLWRQRQRQRQRQDMVVQPDQELDDTVQEISGEPVEELDGVNTARQELEEMTPVPELLDERSDAYGRKLK